MDAIQAVAVQHYFQQRVVPRCLHRVERLSQLPYKRLRRGDFVDRSCVLTAADLERAKQQAKEEEYTELVRCVEAALMADSVDHMERDALLPQRPDADLVNLTTYERVLLMEATDAEAAAATVARDFPHITHHRVQHLLEESGIPLEVVRRTPPPSPPPPPQRRDDEGEEEEASPGMSGMTPVGEATPGSSRSRSASPPPQLTPVQRRRENTRLYFAAKGLPTRRGVLPFRRRN
ncbi:hypothetical protein STCU_12260 [Strigomonas culicis]|uniref:Uncharacterized protein n=1 Tax=Strigomonas culicis TaxID=28005 RepID=S9TFU1_9TRYP|nr:hypothetical protein STCU_12260 [Strigomonas culicis]|eukprot:EPY15198.1 hypothetical protein STCU_12260 [Strigomonas culicis]